MDQPANPTFTPIGSSPDGHYQIDGTGSLIWMCGLPPQGFMPYQLSLHSEVPPIVVWYLPVCYVPQPVQEQPTYFAPSVQLFQLGVTKGEQTGGVNVDYWDLQDYLIKFFELGGVKAQEVSEELIIKLNSLVEKHQAFCEFFANSAPRLLEINTLLKHVLRPYKAAFGKFQNKTEVMQIYDAQTSHTNDLHILDLYQEYCTLVYQSRSLWVTTDSVGVTGFIDGKGDKHQVTLKLYASALCAERFHISDQCSDALLRKAGFSVDGHNVKYVRWAGEF